MSIYQFQDDRYKRYNLKYFSPDMQLKYELKINSIINWHYRYDEVSKVIAAQQKNSLPNSTTQEVKNKLKTYKNYFKAKYVSQWYRKQGKKLIKPEIWDLVNETANRSVYTAIIKKKSEDIEKCWEFIYYPSEALIGLYKKIEELEIYLSNSRAEIEKIKNNKRWWFFRSEEIPDMEYNNILSNIDIEIKKIRKMKFSYTHSVLLRLIEASNAKDPNSDDVILETVKFIKKLGTPYDELLDFQRNGLNREIFLYFNLHIIKYGSPEEKDRMSRLYWYNNNDALIKVSILSEFNPIPIPSILKNFIPLSLKKPKWFFRYHNLRYELANKNIYLIARANGLASKIKFSTKFHDIDLENIYESITLQEIKELSKVFKDEIEILNQNKISWIFSLFSMKYNAAINKWEEYLIETSKKFILESEIEFASNILVEIRKVKYKSEIPINQKFILEYLIALKERVIKAGFNVSQIKRLDYVIYEATEFNKEKIIPSDINNDTYLQNITAYLIKSSPSAEMTRKILNFFCILCKNKNNGIFSKNAIFLKGLDSAINNILCFTKSNLVILNSSIINQKIDINFEEVIEKISLCYEFLKFSCVQENLESLKISANKLISFYFFKIFENDFSIPNNIDYFQLSINYISSICKVFDLEIFFRLYKKLKKLI